MAGRKGINLNIGNIVVAVLLLVGAMWIACLYQEYRIDYTQNSSGNVLYINSPEELVSFSESVNSGEEYEDVHVILQCDLDMKDVENFRPIGIWESGHYFEGLFDGKGHTIQNLSITSSDGDANNGLFGTLAGTICNLTMENCYIKGSACGAFCSIAKSESAQIYNCVVRNVEIDASYTGIIGGQYYGKLENCLIDGYACSSSQEFESDIERLFVQNVDIPGYNQKLTELSLQCREIPMCTWIETGELDDQNMVKPSQMYLDVDSYSYKGKLYPFYRNDVYYFVLPSKEMNGIYTLHVPEDSKECYPIETPKNEVYEQDIMLKDCDYNVKVCYAKNIPSVFIGSNVEAGFDYLSDSKRNVIYGGNIQVLNAQGVTEYIGGIENIHGRGNDSWRMPKKGFTVNLLDDANLLNMGADKEYALLPGYRDSSLLTYKVVQELAKEMKLEYAPEYRFVNFYADGEYQGIYILAEKMTIGYNRINIDNTNRDVTGGYLYELDDLDYQGKQNLFQTEQGNTYVIREPIVVDESQLNYSMEMWEQFEKAIYSPTGYNEMGRYYGDYIDIDSLAKWWLFMEINGEYSTSSSIYFYKDSDSCGDGKLHMLYPWDVEHSYAMEAYIPMNVMLNPGINGTQACGLWSAAYQHQDMKEAVYKNWIELFRPAFCKMLDENTGYNENELSYIKTYGEVYAVSSKWNEIMWGEEQSIEQKGEFIKYYLEERIPYLDEMLKPN